MTDAIRDIRSLTTLVIELKNDWVGLAAVNAWVFQKVFEHSLLVCRETGVLQGNLAIFLLLGTVCMVCAVVHPLCFFFHVWNYTM